MASAPETQRPRSKKSKRPHIFGRKSSSGGTAALPQYDGQGQDASGQPRATQLEFQQAMDDFQRMFPSMERDVIETVLRANNGLVDPTIDQLLTMVATEEDDDSSSEDDVIDYTRQYRDGRSDWSSDEEAPPGYSFDDPPAPPPLPPRRVSLDSRITVPKTTYSLIDDSQSVFSEASSRSSGVPRSRFRSWNPPLLGELPHDFLRLTPRPLPTHSEHFPPIIQHHQHHHHHHQVPPHPKTHYHQSSDLNSEVLRQITENEKKIAQLERKKSLECSSGISSEDYQQLDDEALARFVQNQEFLAMLRGNQEFMETLNRGSPAHRPRGKPAHPGGPTGGAARHHSSLFSPVAPPPGVARLPDGPTVSSPGGGRDRSDSVDHDDDVAAFPYGMPLPRDEEAELKEKLKHMDNPSRRMFLKLANFFHSHRRKKPEQMLGTSTPSTAFLLDADMQEEGADDAGGEHVDDGGEGSLIAGGRR